MKQAVSRIATVARVEMILWLHTAVDPSAEEWSDGMQMSISLREKLGGDASKLHTFVISDGGAPNAAQRKEMTNRAFNGKPSPLACITNSLNNPLKRGVATAISWLNPAFKAVPSDRWRDALTHIGLQPGDLPALIAEFRDLQKQVPPVRTLADLEERAKAIAKK